nr:TetR family transcriptional regulator [uncultured Dyadobacter sp.]
MGRKSLKEVRKKEIIKVFYNLARKNGLENTSIAKIAAKMEMNPSLIIHYFQTREDLVYGLIDYILDKYKLIYKVSAANAADPKKALLEIISNIFSKKWNALFDDGLFYGCYAMTFHDPKVRDLYKKLLDSLRDLLIGHIEQCRQDGVLDVEDVETAADNIFVLIDGAYFYLSLVSDKQEYELRLSKYRQQALSILRLTEASVIAE